MAVARPVRQAVQVAGPLRAVDAAAELAATCYGVGVSVSVDDPELLPALRRRLPPGALVGKSAGGVACNYSIRMQHSAAPDGAKYAFAYAGRASFALHEQRAVMLDAFESAVRFDVAVAASGWTFVHAGVVGYDGHAVLLPGPSRYGKSRLVHALVRAGATYYSDEFAVLDGRGRVHPYPKPVTLREDCGAGRRISAADLGAVGDEPLKAALVACARYRPGGVWRPRRCSTAAGVLTLLANSVRARIAPEATLVAAARATRGAVVVEGVRGDADAAALDILERVGQRDENRRPTAPCRTAADGRAGRRDAS